jgi:hypothetical protein
MKEAARRIDAALADFQRQRRAGEHAEPPEWLREHLRATGDYHPPVHHRLDPPYYDGPGSPRGKHRDGRSRWARFKSWLQDPWSSQ